MHHDVVLLERWSVALNRYHRGDVVTLWWVHHITNHHQSPVTRQRFSQSSGNQTIPSHPPHSHRLTHRSPTNPDLLTTKRIVALEGDLVQPLPPHSPGSVRIPAGHCWVEGDTRFQTRDSNTYGPIPLALINARVASVIWPWGRTGWVQSNMGKAQGRVRRLGSQIQ